MGDELQFITAAKMRELLRACYARDPEAKVLSGLARGLRDPAMPLDAAGRSRPHPLWLALLLFSALAVVSFAIFTALER